MSKKKATKKTEPEFQHDFIFLRSASLEGKSHGGFQWPIESGGMVEAPDWSPRAECGRGLHGIAHGLGDWGLMAPPSSRSALWYVCGGIKAEAVELDGKIKVPRCRVLYVGSFAGAMDMVSPAMTERILEIAQERIAASKPEDGSTASGIRGAATASGDQGAATASGGDSVALACGCRGSVRADRDGCALFLVERDSDDGHVLSVWAGVSGKDCEAGKWYRLEGGNLVEDREAYS